MWEKLDRDFNGYMNWMTLLELLALINKINPTPTSMMLLAVLLNMDTVNDFAHNSHMSPAKMLELLETALE